MREVNIRQLRANLSQELKNLPFAITRNGEIVGIVEEGVHKTEELLPKRVHKTDTKDIGVHKPMVRKASMKEMGVTFNNKSSDMEICKKHNGSLKLTCGCK